MFASYGFHDTCCFLKTARGRSLELEEERVDFRPFPCRHAVEVRGAHEVVVDQFDAFCFDKRFNGHRATYTMELDVRIPTPWFMISMTASVAFLTSGKWTTATLVGSSGASLIVTARGIVYEPDRTVKRGFDAYLL